MGVEQAPTAKGKQAAKGLKQAAAKDERKTEAKTGRPLERALRVSRSVQLRRQERRCQAEELRPRRGQGRRKLSVQRPVALRYGSGRSSP